MEITSTEALTAVLRASVAEPANVNAVRSLTKPTNSDDPDGAPSAARTSGVPPRLADAQALLLAQEEATKDGNTGRGNAGNGDSSGGGGGDPQDLTDEEKAQVQELRQRDQEVRRHERAHAAAAGPYGGAPALDLQRGPDGRFYAIGGEVKIDASPEADPAATIAKMDIVIRAALAPADPSAQDRSVAAQAKAAKAAAQAELREEKAEEARDQQNATAQRRGETASDSLIKDGGANVASSANASQSYSRAANISASEAENTIRLVQSLVA